MTQEPIEVILLRHWASYMAIPIWICGPDGTLVFYNEPAEGLLGRRFDEEGEINTAELADLFVTTDLDGTPIPAADLPIARALSEHHPTHRHLRIRNGEGREVAIEVSAFPIEGQGGRHLGAFAALWEMTTP